MAPAEGAQPVRSVTVPGCLGAVLAGGGSRRMNGQSKALLDVAGKPMLQRVIERLEPQVGELVLSVDSPRAEYRGFGHPQVPDLKVDSGPLGGLASVLNWAAGRWEWLLLAPCDAPFLPLDLGLRLHDAAVRAEASVVITRSDQGLQPAFSIWRCSLGAEIAGAVVDRGMAGFRQFLAFSDHQVLDWPDESGDPFFNVNDPDALQQARERAGVMHRAEEPA